MKVLVFGSSGQLGTIFVERSPRKYQLIVPSRSSVDFKNLKQIKNIIFHHKPKIIINFAAFTDVNGAEKKQDLAFLINAKAPSIIAKSAKEIEAIFIHISTDYVYSNNTSGYIDEEVEIKPCNIYGKSKALGEKLIKENSKYFLIFRTSWLYSNIKKNFFTTISKLIINDAKLQIVNDQLGAPTLVNDVVDALLKILDFLSNDSFDKKSTPNVWGVYNLSNAGETTWFDFACKISLNLGFDYKDKLKPISSHDYKSEAQRPFNSRLNNTKINYVFDVRLPHWENSFDNFVKKQINNGN